MAARLSGLLAGEDGGLVLPQKPVGTSNLTMILFACCIPLNIFFVGLVAAGGGQLLSGGIQFATKVVMLPSFSQQMTRWSWLGSCTMQGGGSLEKVGGQRGVVIWLSVFCWVAFLWDGHHKILAWEVRPKGRGSSPCELFQGRP